MALVELLEREKIVEHGHFKNGHAFFDKENLETSYKQINKEVVFI